MSEQEMGTFLIGCRLQEGVQDAEEYLWSLVGAENSEPIKRELNRTFGKSVEAKSGKKVDFDNPDVIFTVDYEEDRVDKQIAPIYIYGRYKKLVRGIPQTKWPCRECGGKGCKHCDGKGKMYPESVEEIVAAELLRHFQSTSTKFHGKGREDIDALMLGSGRPFVIEIEAPLVRTADLSFLEGKVNASAGGKVEVSEFRASNKQEVIDIKAAEDDKTYECIVKCEGITEGDLKKLEEFFSKEVKLKQRTPTRVAHRRADLVRDKVIKALKAEMIEDGKFKVNITASSGTYIKELISGDSTRTKPSFTEILGKACLCESLNVTEVFGK
jgi:tRNA pseudouridine synthase 10